MLDRLDTLKGTPKQQIYSSRGFPRGYWETYSSPLTPKDTKTPNRKQSTLPNRSFYSTLSSPPNEATTLRETLGAEETRLRALRLSLEETHRTAHSSPKTEGEDGTVTNDSDKEEEAKDSSALNTTPPTHRGG